MAIWDSEPESEYGLMGSILQAAGTGMSNLGGAAQAGLGMMAPLAQSGAGQAVGAGFDAFGTQVHNAFDLMGRPGAAVRNVGLGNYGDDEYGLDPTGIAARGRNFMQGLQGQGTTGSWADALPDMQVGPVNMRGAAGFGLDVLTDPLNLLPTGPVGGAARGAIRGAEFAPRAAEFGEAIPRGLSIAERTQQLAEPATGLAGVARSIGETVPAIGALERTALDPRLVPENEFKTIYTAFQGAKENIGNEVMNLTTHFGEDTEALAAHNRREYATAVSELKAVNEDAGRYAIDRGSKLDFKDTGSVLEAQRETEMALALTKHASAYDRLGLEAAEGLQKSAQAEMSLSSDLKDLANRAGRGEIPTGPMLDPYRKAYPDLVSYFEDIADVARAHKKGSALAADTFLDDLRVEAQAQFRIATETFARAKVDAQTFKAGEDLHVSLRESLSANQNYLKGLWFDPKEAEVLKKYLGQRPPDLLRVGAEASGVSRGIQATLDLSASLIQGLPVLVSEPTAFFKGFVASARSWVDPKYLERYLARPEVQEVLARAPGLQTAANDEFGLPGIVKRIPGIEATLARGEKSFASFGTVARVEWAKSMLPLYEKEGKNVQDLVDLLNHATGVVQTGAMGMSPTQSAAESMMMFAPRYARSTLALVGDAIKDPAGQASQSLFGMLTAGVANYIHLAEAAGQDPALDPKKSTFMSLQVGDARVGIGSIWVSALRTAAMLQANPELAKAEGMANPLWRFWRGHANPLVSKVLDLAEGETYIGTPIQTIPQRLAHGAGLVMPIGLQGIMTDIGATGKVSGVQVGAGVFGARAFPRRVEDIQNEKSQDLYGNKFENLGPVEQAKVRQDPEIKSLPLPQGSKFEGLRDRTGIMSDYSNQLEQAATRVEAGTMTKAQFRDAEHEIAQNRNAQMDFAEKKNGQAPNPSDPKEIARQQYIKLFSKDPISGAVDYDSAEAFYTSLDPSTQSYIDAKRQASLEYLGPKAKALMTDLQASRDTLRPYWEVQNTALKQFGIYDEFHQDQVTGNTAALDKLEKSPKYRAAEMLWKRKREVMRVQNDDIDKELSDWYGYTPIREAIGRRQARS